MLSFVKIALTYWLFKFISCAKQENLPKIIKVSFSLKSNGYCMIDNFCTIQFFVDFACSSYPQKIIEFRVSLWRKYKPMKSS